MLTVPFSIAYSCEIKFQEITGTQTPIPQVTSPLLGSRPFYHEPQQMLDRGNSRLLPFIGFFSLVCPSLRLVIVTGFKTRAGYG